MCELEPSCKESVTSVLSVLKKTRLENTTNATKLACLLAFGDTRCVEAVDTNSLPQYDLFYPVLIPGNRTFSSCCSERASRALRTHRLVCYSAHLWKKETEEGPKRGAVKLITGGRCTAGCYKLNQVIQIDRNEIHAEPRTSVSCARLGR
jgi:hypothetical protein